MNNLMREWGAIERNPENDWKLWGIVNRESIDPPEYTWMDNKFVYDQDEYKSNTCTVYQAIWAYSDFKGYYVPYEERKELVDLAIWGWLDTSIGWYLYKAVDLVRNYYEDISSVSVIFGSEDYWKAIDMWFSMMDWYKGNREYNDDRDDDKVVQSNNWGATTYWHALRGTDFGIEDTVKKVDNYKWRDSNVYSLPTVSKKIESGNMFVYSYFYFNKIEPPMAELPPHIIPDRFVTTDSYEIAKARETEMQAHINNGWKLLYSNYNTTDIRDFPQVLARYLNDLQEFRR